MLRPVNLLHLQLLSQFAIRKFGTICRPALNPIVAPIFPNSVTTPHLVLVLSVVPKFGIAHQISCVTIHQPKCLTPTDQFCDHPSTRCRSIVLHPHVHLAVSRHHLTSFKSTDHPTLRCHPLRWFTLFLSRLRQHHLSCRLLPCTVIPHICAPIVCPHVCLIPVVSVIPACVNPSFAIVTSFVCLAFHLALQFREIFSCSCVCPFPFFGLAFAQSLGFVGPLTAFPRTLCTLAIKPREQFSRFAGAFTIA